MISPKKTICFVAAGKGGVGKTTYAVKLAEWCIRKGNTPVCLDADAFNKGLSLASYETLNAERLTLIDGNEVVKHGFNRMVDLFGSVDGPFIIDLGSNTFRQAVSYCIELGLPEFMEENGFDVEIHAIIGGGMKTTDCVDSIEYLAKELPWPFVVVLNEFDGQASVDGRPYLESKQFMRLALEGRIAGTMRTAAMTDVQRAILEKFKDLRLTTAQFKAADGPEFTISSKMIIGQWANSFFSGLDGVAKFKEKATA